MLERSEVEALVRAITPEVLMRYDVDRVVAYPDTLDGVPGTRLVYHVSGSFWGIIAGAGCGEYSRRVLALYADTVRALRVTGIKCPMEASEPLALARRIEAGHRLIPHDLLDAVLELEGRGDLYATQVPFPVGTRVMVPARGHWAPDPTSPDEVWAQEFATQFDWFSSARDRSWVALGVLPGHDGGSAPSPDDLTIGLVGTIYGWSQPVGKPAAVVVTKRLERALAGDRIASIPIW